MLSNKSQTSQPFSAPSYGTAPTTEKAAKNDTYTYPTSSGGEGGPVYSSGSLIHTTNGRILLVVMILVLLLMFVVALVCCIISAVKYKAPRYFALIVNMILSSLVTGAFIFWLYRGILASSMIWYIFVQSTFLFFQFVTTDIFAWTEQQGIPMRVTPMHPAHNCTPINKTHFPPQPGNFTCVNHTRLTTTTHKL